MRTRLCLVLLLSLASVCFAQVSSVPIIDEASLHSPLDNEGSVTLQRSIEGTSAEVTYSQNWIVRNISSKPILAVHQVLVVHHAEGGSGVHQANSDMFFGEVRLEPGATLDFSSSPITDRHQTTQSDLQSQIVSCEVTEQWVQFEDGTTFGSPSSGRQALSSRRADLLALEGLNQAYVDGGQEGFLRQLQQPSPASIYIGALQSIQQRDGTQKAVQLVQKYLTMAKSRKTLL